MSRTVSPMRTTSPVCALDAPQLQERAQRAADAYASCSRNFKKSRAYVVSSPPEVVGHGSTSVVLRARPPGGGPEVAIKCIDTAHTEQAMDEVGVMCMLHGVTTCTGAPATARYIDCLMDSTTSFLITELASSNVRTLMVRARLPPPPNTRATLSMLILESAAVLHAHGIVHGDLKPENVLFFEASVSVCVHDFGVARPVGRRVTHDIMTPSYRPPEVCRSLLQHGECWYTTAADVWSMGVLLAEVLLWSVCPLFHWRADVDSNAWQLSMLHLLGGAVPARLSAAVPAQVADIVIAMLDDDPARRPSMSDAAARMRTAAVKLATPS